MIRPVHLPRQSQVINKDDLGTEQHVDINVPKVVKFKSFPNHEGRPGLVGGSLPKGNGKVDGEVESVDQVTIRSGIGRAYIITSDDILVDCKGDHYTYIKFTTTPEAIGITSDDQNRSSITSKILQKVFDSGVVRVRDFGDDSVYIMTSKVDNATFRRLRRLVDSGKLRLGQRSNYWYSFDISGHSNKTPSYTYEEFMSAKHVIPPKRLGDESFELKQKVVKLKSYPNHPGRPGLVGGSMPKGVSSELDSAYDKLDKLQKHDTGHALGVEIRSDDIYENKYVPFIMGMTLADQKRYIETTIDLSEVTPTQKFIPHGGLKEYIGNPPDELPEVYRYFGAEGDKYNGKLFVAAGHTRMGAAILRGETTVKVKYYEVYYAGRDNHYQEKYVFRKPKLKQLPNKNIVKFKHGAPTIHHHTTKRR